MGCMVVDNNCLHHRMTSDPFKVIPTCSLHLCMTQTDDNNIPVFLQYWWSIQFNNMVSILKIKNLQIIKNKEIENDQKLILSTYWCVHDSWLVWTYRSVELHKWRRGAVVKVWFKPTSVHITVSDSCTCDGHTDVRVHRWHPHTTLMTTTSSSCVKI